MRFLQKAIARVKDKYHIPDAIRGIPASRLYRRGEGHGVAGYPCPCMACEHIFPRTDGIKIFDDGSITGIAGQVRMNPVTNHLASHGINNNGNSGVDRDHRYMTLTQYREIYVRRIGAIDLTYLDHKKIAYEVMYDGFDLIREKLGLTEKISDAEMEKLAKELLFIEDVDSK